MDQDLRRYGLDYTLLRMGLSTEVSAAGSSCWSCLGYEPSTVLLASRCDLHDRDLRHTRISWPGCKFQGTSGEPMPGFCVLGSVKGQSPYHCSETGSAEHFTSSRFQSLTATENGSIARAAGTSELTGVSLIVSWPYPAGFPSKAPVQPLRHLFSVLDCGHEHLAVVGTRQFERHSDVAESRLKHRPRSLAESVYCNRPALNPGCRGMLHWVIFYINING